jgi:hypothetical protein
VRDISTDSKSVWKAFSYIVIYCSASPLLDGLVASCP